MKDLHLLAFRSISLSDGANAMPCSANPTAFVV